MGWQDGAVVETKASAEPAWKAGTRVNDEQTSLDSVLHQLGLFARAAVTGATSVPALFADLPSRFYNAGAGALNLVAGKPVIEDRAPVPSEALQRNLTRAGLPEPQNATERVVQDVASGMAGAGSMAKAGTNLATSTAPVVAKVGERLAAGPGMQVISGATGPAAAGITRENGGGPVAQLVAGLAGGAAPAATLAAGSAAVRAAARGGEAGRQTMVDRIKTFEDAGTEPSVGQATGNRAMQATESGLSKAPGGAGPMVSAAEKQGAEMATKVNTLADQLLPNASSTKAGAIIEKGVKDFVARFRGEQNNLYDKLDTHIASNTPISTTNTKAALEALNSDIPGAPALSEWFKNAKIKGIEGAFKSDTEGAMHGKGAEIFATTPELPYEAVKKLRTLVGNEISNNTIASDVPRSKWKALYAALSEDLGGAAQKAGPDAEQAFHRANAYSAAGYNRIETFLDRVAGKDTVEKVFQAATNPSELKEGGSTINAVMRSLDGDQRKAVQAAFIKRMGVATAGNQNELGERFSPATFLTNWNKVSPEARMTLFADGGGDLVKNLTKVAEASNMIKEGSKVFANPSGTQQALSNQATTGGFVAALLLGHPMVAGGIAAGTGGANLTARLMTNPKFVSWLATSTKVSPALIPSQLNALAMMSKSQPPEVRKEMQDYAKSVGQQLLGQLQE